MRIYNMQRFYGEDGIKRNLRAEDIYDKNLKLTFDQFVAKIAEQLAVIADIRKDGFMVIANDIDDMKSYKYPRAGLLFWVIDATADATVKSGGAAYITNKVGNTLEYDKIAETESMDVSLDWANVIDKPTSTVTDIDDAVTKKHSHDNKAIIDNISKNADGNLVYNSVEMKVYTGVDYRPNTASETAGNFTGKIKCAVEEVEVDQLPPRG